MEMSMIDTVSRRALVNKIPEAAWNLILSSWLL